MKVDSFADDKKIVYSGVDIIEKDEKFTLDVDTEGGFKFKVILKIDEANKEKGINIKTQIEDDKDAEVCITKNGEISELGTGFSERINLGYLDGKELSLFMIFYKMFQGKFYKIEYAFYLG